MTVCGRGMAHPTFPARRQVQCPTGDVAYHARMPTAAKKRAASGQPQDTAALPLRQFRIVFNTVRTHFQQVGSTSAWAGPMSGR